ncbi:unnamed protein product, partial [Schistosoma turkestanicum]
AEYDSGAQDLCGEPQSLHLLIQRDFPDLYKIVFSLLPYNSIKTNFDNPNVNTTNNNPMYNFSNQQFTNLSKHTEETQLFDIIKSTDIESNACSNNNNNYYDYYLQNVKHLFECANTIHIQRTTQLRAEIRDLSHRLQGLQTNRDMHYREIQRLHCEKQQLHNEFTNQISRYEDRLTELHSVIAELRRRLEHSESNIIHEVEEFEENDHDDDDDVDDGDENEDEAEQEQQHDKQVDNNNNSDGLIIKNKSDEKSIKSKFPPITASNHNHANTNNQSAVNYNEFVENTHDDNSDTSVDVMMDGDDDDDEVDGDDADAPVEHIHHKPIDIVRQYQHQSKSIASNYFMLQTTNLIYDQLNHRHGLSYPEKNMEDMSKNDNHDL